MSLNYYYFLIHFIFFWISEAPPHLEVAAAAILVFGKICYSLVIKVPYQMMIVIRSFDYFGSSLTTIFLLDAHRYLTTSTEI